MSRILTPVTSMHEHYLSVCYSAPTMTRIATINMTAAGSVTAAALANVAGTLPTFNANTKLFAVVNTITDIPAALGITIKNAGTAVGSATIVAHSPFQAAFPIQQAGAWTVSPATGFTIDLTGAVVGVSVDIYVLDDDSAKWFDLGLNYQEGLSFDDGATSAPVGRGYNATDHSKRIPNANSWNLSQLYSSHHEGCANLRGKTFMIKDEVRTDGGAVIKETTYVQNACALTVVRNIGGGGGAAAADSVSITGYYQAAFKWCADATAMTA